MTKIWQRYFFKEILKVFFLFLFCFYGLYIVIDYTTHASTFHHHQNHFAWDSFIIYYASEFIHRSDVLIPFALLVATVRTVTKLNGNNELTALRAAGIPLKKLMSPFVYVGLFFTLLAFVNEQWFLPESMNWLKKTHDSHSSNKRKLHENLAAQHLVLKDETTLLFQYYDLSKGLFFDTFWVKSPDEIYRIKILDPHSEEATGYHVDQLARSEEGVLAAVASLPEKNFPEMQFNKKTLLETITPLENLSLTKLWDKWPEDGVVKSDKEAQVMTALYYKMALPWLCLFAVIAPLPLCVQFSRQIPLFFLYAINIFGLVAVYLIFDSAQVLGKRQMLDPALVIWGPFALFCSLFVLRYCRMR